MRSLVTALIAIAALVAGCSIRPDEERSDQAREAYVQMAEGRYDDLLSQADTSAFDPVAAPGQLAEMRRLLPPQPIPESRPVRWTAHAGTGGHAYEIVQEYDYDGAVAVAQVVMVRQGERWLVHGMHIQVATDEELAPFELNLLDKPPAQLALLALGAGILALTLVSIGVALWRRRWGWAALSAIGVGLFQMDWSTGQYLINPLNIQLFGVGLVKGGSAFDPWILSLSAPLGAVLFWLTGRWRRPATRNSAARRRSLGLSGPEDGDGPS